MKRSPSTTPVREGLAWAPLNVRLLLCRRGFTVAKLGTPCWRPAAIRELDTLLGRWRTQCSVAAKAFEAAGA